MLLPLFWKAFFLISLITSNAFAQSTPNFPKDPTERALRAFSVLQGWYNRAGLWSSTGWWNGANVMTTIGDLAKADPDNYRLKNEARRIFAKTARRAPSKNPQPGIETKAEEPIATFDKPGLETNYNKTLNLFTFEPHTSYPPGWFTFPSDQNQTSNENDQLLEPTSLDADDWLDGYYDDDLWWALAWINAYDVSSHTPYLTLASGIFKAVSRTWPTYCGNGGIYWSWEREYVNAIPNELFFSTAAHLANRYQGSRKKYYIDWAERSLAWFLRTGMINEEGTINDGLTEECENNGKTTWSYNQGVILGGLVELNIAAPKTHYLQLAHRIAYAALDTLSDKDGVIHDECEPECGADGTQFKGVFMRGLRRLNEVAPRRRYQESIRKNAESIWRYDRGRNGVLSVLWSGPWVRPGNASTHSSAMDALVAAVSVGKEE